LGWLDHNPWIRSLKHVPRFFVDPFTLTTLAANADYRPVLQTTYALNYAISQYNPWSWHLFNLILHIIVALSLYCSVERCSVVAGSSRLPVSRKRTGIAILGAALLFAVHPIPTGLRMARSACCAAFYAGNQS